MGKTLSKEPGDIDIELLRQLTSYMHKNNISPGRILILGKKEYLLVNQGTWSEGWHIEDYGIAKPSKFERGDILDTFSKIEFLINEIILVNVLEYSHHAQSYFLDKLLDRIDLFSKIQILNPEIIDNRLADRIMKVKQVRNALAHLWHIDKILYEGDTLKKNFRNFQEDMVWIWKELIRSYEKIVDQNKLMAETLIKLQAIVDAKVSKD